MKRFELVAVLEQFFISNREQGAPQRRKHRQLIVWPLDGGKRSPQRLDFATIVKRPAADEQMRDTACFERLYVRPSHVISKADKPAEQEADMPGLNRDQLLVLAA